MDLCCAENILSRAIRQLVYYVLPSLSDIEDNLFTSTKYSKTLQEKDAKMKSRSRREILF